MSVSKKCLVALCFVFLGKSIAMTNYIDLNDEIEPIELNWYSKTQSSGSTWGKYPEDAQHIEIATNTELIPVKAFQEAKYLRFIKGVNKNIRFLAGNSFFNLPVVEKIDLAFNLIRYIQEGVFVNVSVTKLDLSWNRIMYIEENWFHGLRNLKQLDLSHNEIPLFYDLPSMSPLQKLNLSYNFIENLDISSKTYPNLTVLDLSFNKLKGFGITSEIPMKKIDLTMNFLNGIDKFNVGAVEELRLAMNKFTFPPGIILEAHVNIRKISIYPNTWNCLLMRKMWRALQEHNITLLGPDTDHRIAAQGETSPICADMKDWLYNYNVIRERSEILGKYNLKFIKDKHTSCERDHMCSNEELCRNRQCFNPCKENVCDFTSLCQADNHTFRCNCPSNQGRDPEDLYSRCTFVQV